MENNGESSKQKPKMNQTTLNFPRLITTRFDLSSKKGKNKIIDHEEKITPSNTVNRLRQTTLNFPSITNNKRSFSKVDADLTISDDTNIDDDESGHSGDNDMDVDDGESDDNTDECSDDEYNELPLDGEIYMCDKEKKLRWHKYFSQCSIPLP